MMNNYSHCLNGPWCKRLWAVVNVHLHWKFWFNEVCCATIQSSKTFTDLYHSLKLQTYASSCLQRITLWNLTDWRLVSCKNYVVIALCNGTFHLPQTTAFLLWCQHLLLYLWHPIYDVIDMESYTKKSKSLKMIGFWARFLSAVVEPYWLLS